jgi:hypothetical protein
MEANKITYVKKHDGDYWFVNLIKLVKYVCNIIIFSQITLVEFVLEQIGRFSKCVKILILQSGLLGRRLQCPQGQNNF